MKSRTTQDPLVSVGRMNYYESRQRLCFLYMDCIQQIATGPPRDLPDVVCSPEKWGVDGVTTLTGWRSRNSHPIPFLPLILYGIYIYVCVYMSTGNLLRP